MSSRWTRSATRPISMPQTARTKKAGCGPIWRMGLFRNSEDYLAEMNKPWLKEDWHIHAIIDERSGLASGLASYMRIEPEAGSIEVGAIMYSPRLQRTTAGTEAMYLMMKRVFDELGYRRYEWRCSSLNEASAKAAKRLGFRFEGFFDKRLLLRAVIGTLPGSLSSTGNGRRLRWRLRLGWHPRILMPKSDNAKA